MKILYIKSAVEQYLDDNDEKELDIVALISIILTAAEDYDQIMQLSKTGF